MKHRTVGIRDVHLHPYVFGHFKLSISWQRDTFVTICRFQVLWDGHSYACCIDLQFLCYFCLSNRENGWQLKYRQTLTNNSNNQKKACNSSIHGFIKKDGESKIFIILIDFITPL